MRKRRRKEVRRTCPYLTTSIRPHSHVPICSTCKTGVHTRAERRFALFAIPAASVGDVEGEDDAVAFLEERNSLANFGDDAHVLMA